MLYIRFESMQHPIQHIALREVWWSHHHPHMSFTTILIVRQVMNPRQNLEEVPIVARGYYMHRRRHRLSPLLRGPRLPPPSRHSQKYACSEEASPFVF
jgi:hypothetical protein